MIHSRFFQGRLIFTCTHPDLFHTRHMLQNMTWAEQAQREREQTDRGTSAARAPVRVLSGRPRPTAARNATTSTLPTRHLLIEISDGDGNATSAQTDLV